MAIEIVDFPIEHGGSFYSYVTNYQRLHIDGRLIGIHGIDWDFNEIFMGLNDVKGV